MKIRAVETLSCDAGWRNYHFVKLTTEDGITGWSEFDERPGLPGISVVINQLAQRLIGASVGEHERFYAIATSITRTSVRGIVSQAIGALENAMLDAKARTLEVPCYQLLGGKIRDRLPVYWSPCPTWRIAHPRHYTPAVRSLEDVSAVAREVRERGFKAMKTNMFLHDGDQALFWRPAFGSPFAPEINVDRKVLNSVCAHLEALRAGAGPDVELLIDLNFNAKTEGILKILRATKDMDLFWVEVDSYDPQSLAYVRDHSPHPISSGETLFGIRDFLPFLRADAMDVAIVDAVWNGVWQAMKIAAVAEAHQINVAPHNFYGHLCTMMNAHFAAALPNLRIMETDIDRISWDHELFTKLPEYQNGELLVPDGPGWGTEPIEEAMRAHPPRAGQ